MFFAVWTEYIYEHIIVNVFHFPYLYSGKVLFYYMWNGWWPAEGYARGQQGFGQFATGTWNSCQFDPAAHTSRSMHTNPPHPHWTEHRSRLRFATHSSGHRKSDSLLTFKKALRFNYVSHLFPNFIHLLFLLLVFHFFIILSYLFCKISLSVIIL